MPVEFYTPQQVAERLALSLRSVQNAALSGSIPGAKKIGNQWRFNIAVS